MAAIKLFSLKNKNGNPTLTRILRDPFASRFQNFTTAVYVAVWANSYTCIAKIFVHRTPDLFNVVRFVRPSENVVQNIRQQRFSAILRTFVQEAKYSAEVIGSGGVGGEHDLQVGFGWSNGVILDLFRIFGQDLTKDPR